MGFMSELDNLTLDELISCYYGPPLDGDKYAVSYYDEVVGRIRDIGQPGIDFLFDQLDKADEVRLGSILAFLPRPEHPVKLEILLGYLLDERPSVVMNAIEGLYFQKEKAAINEVLALRNHPDQYVRGAVLRYMSNLYPEQAVPMLLEALNDPDFIVRESAVDELDDLGATEAIPYIRPLLNDPHPDVQQSAQWAIEHLEETLAGA